MADKTSKVLPSCIPLPLQPEELVEIVSKAKDYALMRGICLRQKANYNPDALHVSRQNFDSRSMFFKWKSLNQ